MNIKIKRIHTSAIVPKYATDGSAGVDLHSTTFGTLAADEHAIIPTGLQIEIPNGYVGLVFPRSGNAAKFGITLSNAVGVIDADFRGELKVLLHNAGNEPFEIKQGDRIAQLVIMPYPKVNYVEVDDLTDTERGNGGFGSTGR